MNTPSNSGNEPILLCFFWTVASFKCCFLCFSFFFFFFSLYFLLFLLGFVGCGLYVPLWFDFVVETYSTTSSFNIFYFKAYFASPFIWWLLLPSKGSSRVERVFRRSWPCPCPHSLH
jgi:hypothetical protein